MYQLPVARCTDCGRERPCTGTRAGRPQCVTCRNRGWKPPTARCTVCDRERPCHHARTDHAICQSCLASSHREPCAFCGKTGRVAARTARGAQCPLCRSRALSTMIRCARCDRVARSALDDPSVCAGCAGEPVGPSCRTCGAADRENYADHRCGRCVLSARLDRLAAGGDPDAVALLQPYLSALRDGPKPWSVLNWMTVSRGYDTLRELVAGTVPLSHKALDDLDRGQSTRYLRAALVRHGALPSRNDADALTAWIAREIARLPESEDRTHLRAFATWQVQHDLQRRAQRGQTTRSSHRLARTHIRVAAALICWLTPATSRCATFARSTSTRGWPKAPAPAGDSERSSRGPGVEASSASSMCQRSATVGLVTRSTTTYGWASSVAFSPTTRSTFATA